MLLIQNVTYSLYIDPFSCARLNDYVYVCICLFQFLEKGGISHLCRENFTFSTKVNIGRFYEQRATTDEVRKLSFI